MDKPSILGLIQRGGQVVLHMLDYTQQATIKPAIAAAVAPGILVHTDEYSIYARFPVCGYRHKTVCHGRGEYARNEDGDGFCDARWHGSADDSASTTRNRHNLRRLKRRLRVESRH